MIPISRAILKSFFLACLFSTSAACQTLPPEAQNAVVFGKSKDAVTLDPADATDGESSAVLVNMFDTLLRFDDEKTTIRPSLAKSWGISKDKLVWTFKLQPNVKFHDGTPLDATAIKFNYERQMDTKHPHRYNGKFEYWPLFFNSVKRIEAPAPDTVVFHLNRVDATFQANLAIFTMGISSPTAIKKHGADYFKNPVGSGPFQFKKWIRNEKIVLQKNHHYWDTPPQVDLLIFKPVPDNSVRLLELETKSIQVLDGINPDDVSRIRSNPELKLLTQPGLNVGYLAMNTEKKPFDSRDVRLAINHAINKEALVQAFFSKGTLGTMAKNPLAPTVWSYNDDIKDHVFDPNKAKQLLQKSGYPNGFKAKLWAMPIARPYMPQPQRIAEAIQADLQKIGISLDIVTYDWGTYLDKLAKGEHEMALMGWIGDNGDPDNFIYTLLDQDNTKKGSASNYAFYKNKELHTLLTKAQKVYDQKERTALYRKAQELIHADAPWVPLFHSMQMMATLSPISGFKLHPVGEKRFKNVKVSH